MATSLHALELYIIACKRKRLADLSIATYSIRLNALLASAPADLAAVSLEHIETWLDTRGLCPSSLRNYLVIIGTFFHWCVIRGLLATSPIPHGYQLPRARPRVRASLSLDELTRLLNYVRDNTYISHRNHAMWNLIGLTGLRVSECAALRVGDLTENGLLVRHAKGDKQRVVPLPPRARAVLAAYMPYLHSVYLRKPYPDDWLFPNPHSRKPLRRRGLALQFRRDILSVDIHGAYTIHSLRHTYATLLVRAGVGLPILQELLGHSHIQTTMIYLHISAADTAAAADKHPLAN